jgi:hypothetical protein
LVPNLSAVKRETVLKWDATARLTYDRNIDMNVVIANIDAIYTIVILRGECVDTYASGWKHWVLRACTQSEGAGYGQ